MKTKIIIWVGVLAVAAMSIAAAVSIAQRQPAETASKGVDSALAAYFQEQITSQGIAKVGHPIEGFDANLLLRAFPGLAPIDFSEVETHEGHYEVTEGEMTFVRDQRRPISTVERTVSKEGYGTLLENIAERLDMNIAGKADIDRLIENVSAGQQQAEYRNTDIGFSFTYRSSSDGYVISEHAASEAERNGFVEAVSLMTRADYEELEQSEEAREGPPTITVQVFENPDGLSPEAWASANPSVSNNELRRGDITPVSVAGADAIRYSADGLYLMDTVVIDHGEFIVLITGSYLDEDSMIRKDFEPFLDSFSFLQTTG